MYIYIKITAAHESSVLHLSQIWLIIITACVPIRLVVGLRALQIEVHVFTLHALIAKRRSKR